MYKITCELPADREPWNISLSQRIKAVLSAVHEKRHVALMVYERADTSTFRYRCYNVYQTTNRGLWRSVYFFMNELDVVERLLEKCQLLILTRVKWSYPLNNLVAKAKKSGITVLFDVDDLVCNVQYLPLLTNTLNVHFGSEADYDFWFAYVARNEAAARLADGFITTNQFLGEKLSQYFDKPYQIIMNSLNEEQLQISELCRKKKKVQKSEGVFSIGYFSGTPSHINDFRVIYRELLQLLEDYPQMVLHVVGFMEFPNELQSMLRDKRITFTPLVDFMELQRLIAQVDVNIVPLLNNVFTNCKSELKFFEAAAVDTVTIATPTYTYEHAIQHGITGFLCRQGQWYDTIVELYQRPELRQQISEDAETYCLNTYAGDLFRKQVCSAYSYFQR